MATCSTTADWYKLVVGQNCFTLPLITQLFLAARPLAGGALALPLGLAAPSRIGKVSKSRQSGLTRPPGLAASNTFLSFAATSVGLLTASGSGLRGGHLCTSTYRTLVPW